MRVTQAGVTAIALTLTLACARAPEQNGTPAAAGDPFAVPAADPAATRVAMGEIVEALRVVLPASLDPERFSNPANREPISAALAELTASAEALEAHQSAHDPEAGFLSRSLAADVSELAVRFEGGRWDEARFLMTLLVDNCVACHSRTPDVETRTLGTRLLANVDPGALETEELARLQAATRQFDAALDTWEAVLRAAEPGPAELVRRGLLVDYLIVAVRVKNDLDRPRPVLEALAAHGETPAAMAVTLLAWSGSLAELADRVPLGSPLEVARALIDVADSRSGDGHESDGLVYEIVASARLYRLLESGAPTVAERAEAFYLLGLVESRIRQSSWILQAEFYLEAAIRTAPGGPWAQAAYDLLEQEVVADYSGSVGGHLPGEVASRLQGLADLIAEARLGS